MRTTEDIGNIIREMDKKYDANFGYWVRGEENIETVVLNLKKYLHEYSEEIFAEVLKWITEKWRIESKVVFLMSLLHAPIAAADDLQAGDARRNLAILQRTVTTWDAAEIADVAAVFMKDLSKERRGVFLQAILQDCSYEQSTEVFIRIDHLVEWSTKIAVLQHIEHKDQAISKKP